MNGKHVLIGMSLFFALCGASQAAPGTVGGVIQFRGAVVDSSCMLRVGQSATFELNNCPGGLLSETFISQPVVTVQARDRSPINAKAIADGSSRRYRLVDSGGKPVQSGIYWIAVSQP